MSVTPRLDGAVHFVAPTQGQAVRYDATADDNRRYLTDALTPARLQTYIKNVDAGDVAAMVELSEEMEAKDAHLQGVANTRRQALTALPWAITPNTSAPDEKFAAEVADDVESQLRNMTTWPETLEHISTGIGPGVAVSELVWKRNLIDYTVDVPGHRLRRQDDGLGLELDMGNGADFMPIKLGKFICHTPNSRAGFPMRVTIARAAAWCFVLKHYAIADWGAFSELFGMPWRVAHLEDMADDNEREAVKSMLENMTADGWGMFSDAVKFEFIKGDSGTPPYTALIEWIENKQTILYLGQTLTTDVGAVGSFAAAKVHDNVRTSILLSDMQQEARTIRDQVITPMVKMRYPGKSAPIPHFERTLYEQRNLESERLDLEQIQFAVDHGLPVAADLVYEKLGLPVPTEAAFPKHIGGPQWPDTPTPAPRGPMPEA